MSSLRDRRDVAWIMKLMVAGAVIVALLGGVERVVGHNLFAKLVPADNDAVAAALADKLRDGGNRVQSTFEHRWCGGVPHDDIADGECICCFQRSATLQGGWLGRVGIDHGRCGAVRYALSYLDRRCCIGPVDVGLPRKHAWPWRFTARGLLC
jgi:hypothetical protein